MTHVRDPFQLRVNAYRVLLTRGRDGAVIFVPPLAELDATAAAAGARGESAGIDTAPSPLPRLEDPVSMRVRQLLR
ncbi:MAG: DUF2075 domain-containing protein [Actinobacteria bacterium]|nr:DUF2075 domain-containing protein [Actinomycetota bacterium]